MMPAFLWGRSSMQHLRQSPPPQKALGKEGRLGGADLLGKSIRPDWGLLNTSSSANADTRPLFIYIDR